LINVDQGKDNRVELFLRTFFRELEEKGVRYCVLRNYEGLPYSLGEGDLDIYVTPEDAQRIEEVITLVARKMRMRVIQRVYTFHVVGYTVVWNDVSVAEPGIHIDVMRRFAWRGVEFFPCRELFEKQRKLRGISVPHPVHEAFISLLDRVLWGGEVGKKHSQSIASTITEHEQEWSRLLSLTFGSSTAETILKSLRKEDLDYLLQHQSLLQWKSLLHGFLRNPGKNVSGFLLHYLHQLRNLLRPRGFFVALIGPDGAGKSTIVEGLDKALLRLHLITRVFHWRPFLFKPLRDLTRTIVTNQIPKSSETSGTLVSFLRLMYYTADYIIGYFLRVLPVLRRGGIVLFDRYFFDYSVDPERVRTKFLGGMPRFLYRFVPHPDAVFLVQADPETIHSRKPELSIAEIDRQLKAFQNLSRFVGPLLTVATEGNPLDSTGKALKALFGEMQRKTVAFSLRSPLFALRFPRSLKRKFKFAAKRVLDSLPPSKVYFLVLNLIPGTQRFLLRRFGSVVKRTSQLSGTIKVGNPSLLQINQRAIVSGLEVRGPMLCLIDHDSRAQNMVFATNTIVTENNLYQGDDRIEKSVTISVDIDGAVGLAHVPKNEFEDFRPFWNEREHAEQLKNLLKAYRIPTVWSLSGHLFLNECTGEHPFEEKQWYGDWFLFDPGTNYREDPGWYMPDFIRTLMEEPLFEIGYHSFAHFTYSRCSRETVLKDMEFAAWIRKEYRLPLESFVFPHGTVGYIDEIVKGGFTNLRGIIGRRPVARTVDFGSFLFYCTSRYLNSFSVGWCTRKIDETRGKNFNYYTHAWDWKTQRDFDRLERFLERLATLQEKGKINLRRMGASENQSEHIAIEHGTTQNTNTEAR